MNLPRNKSRNGVSFELVEYYHSKIDAIKNLKRIKNENALFGKRKRFLFESKKENIVSKFGIYEQALTVPKFEING